MPTRFTLLLSIAVVIGQQNYSPGALYADDGATSPLASSVLADTAGPAPAGNGAGSGSGRASDYEQVDIIDESLWDAIEGSYAATTDYVIKPKDILKIIVYGEPELSQESIRVSIDGSIGLPLIGNLMVAGSSISDVEHKIEVLLKDGYLLTPEVSILLNEYGRRVLFVLGSVGSPGSFGLTDELTLLEILTQAGGVADDAADKILIKRTVGGSRKTIVINRKRLLEDGDLRLNIPVYDQDFIFVPPSEIIYILGEVGRPGTYPLHEKNRTAFRALLEAGLTEAAAKKRIRIIRDNAGTEEIITVNLDDLNKRGDLSKDVELKPQDIIIVPLAYF